MSRTDGTFDNKQKIAAQRRKPLRSFNELAEEFGVDRGVLMRAFAEKGAPRSILNRSTGIRAAWYDPDEVRAWWKKRCLQEHADKQPNPEHKDQDEVVKHD